MVVSINLSVDTERKLQEVAKRRGQTLETYLEWLAVTSVGNGGSAPAEQTAESWVAAWRDFVDSHASNPHVADDSRESFYGDRGL